MRPVFLFGAVAFLLVACSDPPTEADRAEVIGIWQPDDGSGRNVQFKPDGVFDYNYDAGYILWLDWRLESKGRVALTSGNGVTVKCDYSVSGSTLHIHNGSDGSCIGPSVDPPSPMPIAFQRMQ